MFFKIISFFVSFFCVYWLIYFLLPILRRHVLDIPTGRSSHSCPTPRGGGISFVMVSVLSSLISLVSVDSAFSWFPLVVLPLALVGFVDDRFSLPSELRFWVQIATSIFILNASNIFSFTLSFLGISIFFTLLFAVVAIINFINFMDGLDGLVAGCMFVSIGSVALKLTAPWSIWALMGSLLGFIVWNWSPAKIFMGDVGSTFLGAVFAVLVLQASGWPEALALLLVATPLLGDACLCVPRRLMAGQQVFQAHRLHLFQRLHQAGWPHARVSTFYITATALLAIASLWGGLPWVITLSALELLIGVWLDRHVAVPFAVASHN